MYSGRFASLTDEALQVQLDTKLYGFMRAIRLVAPAMRAQKWGRIVNIIGGAGKEPDPYMLGSGIANSALLNLTKSLSTELGEDNALVNAVCPGWVDTGLWKRNAEGLQAELGVRSEDEARRLAARKNALGRFGRPEELASAIAFLCSERRATSPACRSTSTAAASRGFGEGVRPLAHTLESQLRGRWRGV
jgi:3-oxoacyl-[acyl-carrier protein] reductase